MIAFRLSGGLFFSVNGLFDQHRSRRGITATDQSVQVDTDRGYITLSRQARDAIGLETDEVSVGEVSSGLFAYVRNRRALECKSVWGRHKYRDGKITRLLVRPGDSVAKDQVVAELSSRELEVLHLEYNQAKK